MRQEVIISNTADLERAAQEFLEKIGDRTLVAFFAPMGSGKTTFTTALCKVLGVTDPVGSPTFAIVNEYMRADGDPMYHFDFYRINKLHHGVAGKHRGAPSGRHPLREDHRQPGPVPNTQLGAISRNYPSLATNSRSDKKASTFFL